MLRLVGKGGQRLLQGGVPLAVVNEVGVVHGQLLLDVEGVLVHGEHFQLLVGEVQDGAAGSLVHAPVLHAHQPVFHDVDDADAVGAAQLR